MKICDIYPYLYTYLEIVDYIKLDEDRLNKDIFHYLKRINVDPPVDQVVRSSSKVKFKSMYGGKRQEDVGQKISRNLFNEKIQNRQSKDCELNGDSKSSLNGDSVGRRAIDVSSKSLSIDFVVESSCSQATQDDSLDTDDSLDLNLSGFDSSNSKFGVEDDRLVVNTNDQSSEVENITNGHIEFNGFNAIDKLNSTSSYEDEFESNGDQNGQLENGQLQNGQLENGQLQNGQLENGQLQNGLHRCSYEDELESNGNQNGQQENILHGCSNGHHSNGINGSTRSKTKSRMKTKSEPDERAEIRTLIKQFKRKQLLRRAKRREEIRKSMQFEVE